MPKLQEKLENLIQFIFTSEKISKEFIEGQENSRTILEENKREGKSWDKLSTDELKQVITTDPENKISYKLKGAIYRKIIQQEIMQSLNNLPKYLDIFRKYIPKTERLHRIVPFKQGPILASAGIESGKCTGFAIGMAVAQFKPEGEKKWLENIYAMMDYPGSFMNILMRKTITALYEYNDVTLNSKKKQTRNKHAY